MTAAGAVASASSRSAVADSDADKAEMIYLEAADAYEDGRYDDYYMLLRRAGSLDPTDPYIRGEIGEMQTISPLTDSAGREDAYRAIRDRYYADVSNYHYATVLAEMAKNMRRYDDLVHVWQTLDSVYPDRTDPAMNLASVYLVQYIRGDSAAYDRCLAIYDRIQRGLGADIGLSSHKIRAYGVRRDTAAVVRELDFLRRSASADIDAQLFIGGTYAQFGMPDSALTYFDRACAIDSTYGPAYLARVELFNMTGDSTAYDREVFRAIESPDLEFDAKFKLLTDYVVKLYSDSTQRPRIAHMFETLQELNPGEAELHAFYGAYNNEIGRPAEAAEQYAYSIALDPSKPEVWQALVMAYGNSDGNNNRVLATAREAARRFPDDIYFPLVASNALLMRNKPAEALALLDSIDIEAVDGNVKQSFYHGQRGDILYRLEMPDSAFAEYDRAIACNPENYGALNNAAYHMAVRGVNLQRAKLYSSMTVQAEPDNTTYLDTYAWVLFKLGEYDEARTYIDSALIVMGLIDPPSPPLDSGAVTEDGNGETEIVEASGEIVPVEVQEPSAEIYDHAGDIRYHTGDRDGALDMWKEALKLDPGNALIKKKVRQRQYFAE